MKEGFFMFVYGYLLIVTILLFVLMGVDKFKAEHNMWRIPEKTLLFLGAIGGGFGGFIGGRIFHHKTRKWYFQVAWIVGMIVFVALILLFR